MVQASKILTVSYGVYSCKLEGFDDPISTMQTVTEYFRDLASDDRFFGAEPPTPDPELLHQMAASTGKRVEAHVTNNDIVLRQVPDAAAATSPAPAPSVAAAAQFGTPSPAPREAARATAQQSAPLTVAAAPTAEPAFSPAGLVSGPESVAAKLARIRAAVNRSRRETEPLINDAFAEDEVAAPSPVSSQAAFAPVNALYSAGAALAEEENVETAEGPASFDIAKPSVDAPPEDAATETGIDPTSASTSTEDVAEDHGKDVVGTKTQPVVSDASADERETESSVADDDAERFRSDDLNEDTTARVLDAVLAAEEKRDGFEPDDVSDTEASVADGLGQTAFEHEIDETSDGVADDELAAIFDAVGVTPSEPGDQAADPEDTFAGNADAFELQDTAKRFDEDLSAETSDANSFEPSADLSSEADVPSEDEGLHAAEHAQEAPRVRVMKMTRAEFEQQFEEIEDEADSDEADEGAFDVDRDGIIQAREGQVDETDPHAPVDDIRETLGETGLSEEDEEDLIRELAEVQQDNEVNVVVEAAMDAKANDAKPTPLKSDRLDTLLLTQPIIDTDDDNAPTGAEEGPKQSSSIAEALESLVAETKRDGDADTTVSLPGSHDAHVDHDDELAGGDTRPVADDASVDRLLSEADTAMKDNEGSRRRSAIAHLKAAVAAVRADGERGRENLEAENARALDRFRQDLAKAVGREAEATEEPVEEEELTEADERLERLKAETLAAKADEISSKIDANAEAEDETITEASADPADVQSSDAPKADEHAAATPEPARSQVTPSPVGTTTERPATLRPPRSMPPLMLVSEQRVDSSVEAGPVAPVRPRRIQADEADISGKTSDVAADGFKSFLAKTKAEGLQEELEASLAYGIFVEGSQHNSRPTIMIRVLRVHPDGSVTREDALRAFGVLLREGRVHRIKRGEFLLPETSRFHPDANPQAHGLTA